MLRRLVLSSRPASVAQRTYTTKIHRLPRPDDAEKDFRPPWVYAMSRLLSYTMIPAVAFYAVFLYDFGEKDHVFQPARRWATRQKSAFFTLSEEEERMLKASETLPTPATGIPQEESKYDT